MVETVPSLTTSACRWPPGRVQGEGMVAGGRLSPGSPLPASQRCLLGAPHFFRGPAGSRGSVDSVALGPRPMKSLFGTDAANIDVHGTQDLPRKVCPVHRPRGLQGTHVRDIMLAEFAK